MRKTVLIISIMMMMAMVAKTAKGGNENLCCNKDGSCGEGPAYCGKGCRKGPCYDGDTDDDDRKIVIVLKDEIDGSNLSWEDRLHKTYISHYSHFFL